MTRVLLAAAVLVLLVTAGGAGADTWTSDSDIVAGLSDIGYDSAPDVFFMDDTWYLIAGEDESRYGYNWTGSTWQSDSSIVSGLETGVGWYYDPHTWYMDGIWYNLYGDDYPLFHGYNWTGSTWQSDSGIESGLGVLEEVDYEGAAATFELTDVQYLIHGAYNGQFTGYNWTGSTWQSDSGIESGLGDIGSWSRPTIFQKRDVLHLIAGASDGQFTGYNWTGSTWQSDSSIASGLGDIGSYSNPEVFQMGGDWYLIAGAEDGKFYGFQILTYAPTNLTHSMGFYWINHTWDVGSGIADYYNVSVNGTWYNDTTDTFFNNTLSTNHQWSNITVYGYNNTEGISEAYVTEDVQLRLLLPPTPIGLDSTWDYYWVNHTWTNGTPNSIQGDTDSYNVSVNGVWHHGVTNEYYNNTLTAYGDWSNITVYAYNNTGGISDMHIYQNVRIPHFIPPTPINLQHTIYNCSINSTWDNGTGYTTDSYNISITTTFCGEVTTEWYTTTSPAYSFVVTCDEILPTIAIYAYNNTHHAQSTENVTETITTLPSTDITDIDFETGYTLGTLNSQQGWTCSAGAGSPVIEVHGIGGNRYAGILTTDADCYAYAQHSIDGWGASKEVYIYFNFEISGYGAGDDAFAIAPSGWGGSPTSGGALLAVRCRCDTSPPYMTINVYNGVSLLYSTSAASGWHSMEAVYNGETGMFTTLKLDGNDIANKNARPIEDFPSSLYICCWANLLGGFSGDYRIGIDDIYIYPIGTFGCYGCEVDCGFHSIVVSDTKNNPIQNADISIYDSTDNEYIQKWVQDDDGIIPLWVFFYGGHTVQVGINTFDGVFIRDIYIDPDGGVSNITLPLNYNLKIYPEDQNGVPLTGVFAGLAEYTPLDPRSFWGFSMSGSQHVPVTNCSGFSMCDIRAEKGGYETYEETALNWTSKNALIKDYRHTVTLTKE